MGAAGPLPSLVIYRSVVVLFCGYVDRECSVDGLDFILEIVALVFIIFLGVFGISGVNICLK